MHIRTYSDAIDYLYGLRLHGVKLGLDTMRALIREIGNPHERLRFIHIAGTNGKGSVAAMLASVFREAGYRTALYTSPHLISFCERFQINNVPVSESEIVRLVEDVRPCVERVAAKPEFRCPTFFEVVTAMAAKYFSERSAEIVIWETGLGGRLDATNVVTPLVSVITHIGMDHTAQLGNALEQIAFEKAGIIKPNVPVVLAPLNDQVSRRISQVAEQLNAPLVNVSTTMLPLEIKRSLAGQSFRLCYKPDVEVRTEPRGIHVKSYVQDYGVLRVPLIGDHQINNCATVVATIEAIRSRDITLDNSAIARGIENTHWPGRFQVIDAKPRIILDGAHNPQAAEVLRDTLKQYLPCEQLTFILGILKDKDCAAICQTLAPLAQDIFTVRVKSERASDPESLATLCATANPSANIRALPSFEDAFRQVKNNADATVVVTGSLFLVGEALQRLGLDPRHAHVTQKEMTMQ